MLSEIVQDFLDRHENETHTTQEWENLATSEGLYNEHIKELMTYLDGRHKSKKGWIETKNLLVIEFQRYWLTDEEMDQVKQIQQTYPNTWKQVVLKRMSTLSL